MTNILNIQHIEQLLKDGNKTSLNTLIQDAKQAQAIAKFANEEMGWNGVENSKILSEFIKAEFQKLEDKIEDLENDLLEEFVEDDFDFDYEDDFDDFCGDDWEEEE